MTTKGVVAAEPRRAVTHSINHYEQEAEEIWAKMLEEYYRNFGLIETSELIKTGQLN